MKFNDAQDWQKDSSNLKTEKVQHWTVSGTMLGVYPVASARENVDAGFAWVVSDQAVADYEDRYMTYNE
jgi:hypothetical protein